MTRPPLQLCATLCTSQDQLLQLQEDTTAVTEQGSSLNIRYFKQLNVKASRKQVMPIVKTYLDNL